MEPLTGHDAADAISLAMRLGAADARFDARRVSLALRASAGRFLIRYGLASGWLVSTFVRTASRENRRSGPRRALRAAAATEAPGRPDASPGRERR